MTERHRTVQEQGDRNRWIGKEGLEQKDGDGNRDRADKQQVVGQMKREKDRNRGTGTEGQ